MYFNFINAFKVDGHFGRFDKLGRFTYIVSVVLTVLKCLNFIAFPFITSYLIYASGSRVETLLNVVYFVNSLTLLPCLFPRYGHNYLEKAEKILDEINENLSPESQWWASVLELIALLIWIFALVSCYVLIVMNLVKNKDPPLILVLYLVGYFFYVIYEHGYVIALFILHWCVTNRLSYMEKDVYKRLEAGIRDILDNFGDITIIRDGEQVLNKVILLRNSFNDLQGWPILLMMCQFIINTLFQLMFVCGSGPIEEFQVIGFPIDYSQKLVVLVTLFILTEFNKNWYNFNQLLIELNNSGWYDHQWVHCINKTTKNLKNLEYTICNAFAINNRYLFLILLTIAFNLVNVRGVSLIVNLFCFDLLNLFNLFILDIRVRRGSSKFDNKCNRKPNGQPDHLGNQYHDQLIPDIKIIQYKARTNSSADLSLYNCF